VTTDAERTLDDGRPGDDPDQTQWHFGARFIMFWVMPLVVVGGAILWWDMIEALRAGDDLEGSSKGWIFLPLYPVVVVTWPCWIVAYLRARRRGETPVPGSHKPR
jgi:hypothetical protein